MIFDIAIRSIKANKLRSVLTSLGIIIGVAAVIIMLAIGHGAQRQLQKEFSTVGSNLIMVFSGVSTTNGVKLGHGSLPTIKKSDSDAIVAQIDEVQFSAPVQDASAQVIYGNGNWYSLIIGTTPDYFAIRDWRLNEGRMFGEDDIRHDAKVVVLGHTVVNELFGDVSPIGKTVRIKGIPFLVIGVLEELGGTTMGQDNDTQVFIPVTTAQKKIRRSYFPDNVRFLMVQARSADDLDTAQEKITQILRQRHNISPNKENDFVLRNLAEIMERMRNSSRIMTILLGSIASISLLVGGIGIMNIMLVSVTERTKEIGIRMAIGAKIWDIRKQFLAEAFIISFIGGILGVAIGIGGTFLVSHFSPFKTMLTLRYILFPLGFSGVLGLFFGFYPAYKASKLNPINALHYE